MEGLAHPSKSGFLLRFESWKIAGRNPRAADSDAFLLRFESWKRTRVPPTETLLTGTAIHTSTERNLSAIAVPVSRVQLQMAAVYSEINCFLRRTPDLMIELRSVARITFGYE